MQKVKYFKTLGVMENLGALGVTDSVILELDAEGKAETSKAQRSITSMSQRLGIKLKQEKIGGVSYDSDKIVYMIRVSRV